MEEGLNVNIAPVDLILKEDGVYKGSYDFGRWSNELTITVKQQNNKNRNNRRYDVCKS